MKIFLLFIGIITLVKATNVEYLAKTRQEAERPVRQAIWTDSAANYQPQYLRIIGPDFDRTFSMSILKRCEKFSLELSFSGLPLPVDSNGIPVLNWKENTLELSNPAILELFFEFLHCSSCVEAKLKQLSPRDYLDLVFLVDYSLCDNPLKKYLSFIFMDDIDKFLNCGSPAAPASKFFSQCYFTGRIIDYTKDFIGLSHEPFVLLLLKNQIYEFVSVLAGMNFKFANHIYDLAFSSYWRPGMIWTPFTEAMLDARVYFNGPLPELSPDMKITYLKWVSARIEGKLRQTVTLPNGQATTQLVLQDHDLPAPFADQPDVFATLKANFDFMKKYTRQNNYATLLDNDKYDLLYERVITFESNFFSRITNTPNPIAQDNLKNIHFVISPDLIAERTRTSLFQKFDAFGYSMQINFFVGPLMVKADLWPVVSSRLNLDYYRPFVAFVLRNMCTNENLVSTIFDPFTTSIDLPPIEDRLWQCSRGIDLYVQVRFADPQPVLRGIPIGEQRPSGSGESDRAPNNPFPQGPDNHLQNHNPVAANIGALGQVAQNFVNPQLPPQNPALARPILPPNQLQNGGPPIAVPRVQIRRQGPEQFAPGPMQGFE